MRRTAAVLLLLLAPLSSCQCAPKLTGPKPGWRWVVRYSYSDDLTQAHIHNLLDAHGIEVSGFCHLGVCDMSVPTDQYEMAVRLLRLELRDRNFLAIVRTPSGPEYFAIEDSPAWQISQPRVRYDELLARPEAAATTELGAALREASVVQSLPQYPYVVRIETLPRVYFGPKRTLETGADFVIGLGDSATAEPGARLGVQVAKGGQYVNDRPSDMYRLPIPD